MGVRNVRYGPTGRIQAEVALGDGSVSLVVRPPVVARAEDAAGWRVIKARIELEKALEAYAAERVKGFSHVEDASA